MKRPEQSIQRAVFQHLWTRGAPHVFSFHPANGGFRTPVEAAILKSMGVRPGVPDVIAIHNRQSYGLELKAPGGRLSEKQAEAIQDMRDAGAHAEVAEGLDEALIILESWGLLRKAA